MNKQSYYSPHSTPFGELIKKDKYQVFLFTCPARLPTPFAVHPWFVVNKKGVVSRWEIGRDLKDDPSYFGYVRFDGMPLFEGLPIISYNIPWSWGPRHIKLLGSIEGDEGSAAQKLADFIENGVSNYPYRNTYHLRGPNSNTYIQWVIDQFPESGFKLPWNAIGKGYKRTTHV